MSAKLELHHAFGDPWKEGMAEYGNWFVKVGDDIQSYLNDRGCVQDGAHWFASEATARAAMLLFDSLLPYRHLPLIVFAELTLAARAMLARLDNPTLDTSLFDDVKQQLRAALSKLPNHKGE